MQCLPSGPDSLQSSFSFPKRTVIHNKKKLFSPLTKGDTGHPNFFKENKNFRRYKPNWKTRELTVDPVVAKWITPRKKIPTHQTTLFIVISSQSNSQQKIDRKTVRTVDPNQKDKFFLPFLSSAMDKASPFVKFHCLSQDELNILKKNAKLGIAAGSWQGRKGI